MIMKFRSTRWSRYVFATSGAFALLYPMPSITQVPRAQIEREKQEVAVLADKLIQSLTNVCEGRLVQFHPSFSRSGYPTELVSNYSVDNWSTIINFYPATRQTQADRMNGIVHRDSITVTMVLSAAPDEDGIIDNITRSNYRSYLYRERDSDENFDLWRDYRVSEYSVEGRAKVGLRFDRYDDGKFILAAWADRRGNRVESENHPDVFSRINFFLTNGELIRPDCRYLYHIYGAYSSDGQRSAVQWMRN